MNKMRKKNNKVVYRHRRLDTNEVFYIGMGSEKRAFDNNFNKRNNFWKKIVSKTNYDVEIVAKNLSWKDACELEIFLISLYGRRDIKTGTLCNLTNGGDGSVGCKRSEETCEKISKVHKGKVVSEKSRQKMRESKKNKYYLKNNPNSKKVINIITGEIFNTLKEAAQSINKNYGSFKWSIRKAKNFDFKYYDE